MLLAIFTTADAENAAPSQGGGRRWHTPSIDRRCASAAIGGSLCVSLAATLCSFRALGERCELSYYWARSPSHRVVPSVWLTTGREHLLGARRVS